MARSHHAQACESRCAFWAACATALSGKKISFRGIILFLVVSSSIIGGACSQNVVGLLSVTPFFPFISLSYHQKSTMVLIFIGISNSVLLVLILVFLSFFLLLKFYLFSI